MPPKKQPQPKQGQQNNKKKATKVLYWHRTDLRLHDSPALSHGLSLSPTHLYQIWTWDPHYIYHTRVSPNRFQFLIDSQNDLSANITKVNPASKLLVFREAPETCVAKLVELWGITHVVFESDTDGYGLERDKKVTAAVEALGLGVEVIGKSGRTLWDSFAIVEKNGGRATMSISQLQAAGKKLGDVAMPLPAPPELPGWEEGMVEKAKALAQEKPGQDVDFNKSSRTDGEGVDKSYLGGIAGPNNDFGVPTLQELGMPEATSPHRGGEAEALRILEEVIGNEKFTATFSKPETSPAGFEPQSTCLTSPHLHFGTLSVRLFWWRVQEVLERYKGETSKPPTSLHGQLLFRDMYFAAQAAGGYTFAQTYGNKHVKFVPWHLPSTVDTGSGLITGDYEIDDPKAEEWFQRWKWGRTGFPWIDALMRQLRQEGWIHHLGRHAVACFLTRGGCYIHWERGAEVFEELLIDHETACNSGNWQWLSCTAFYSQYYRCYSPVAFGAKWDKEGKFVRRYVPELKELGNKYIYEPWKAPIADQRKAGLIVKGRGEGEVKEEGGLKVYPKPMFDFPERREICIKGLKKAYEVGLHGDHPKVLDGSWKELFSDDGEGPTEGSKGGPGGTLGSEDVDIRSVQDDDEEIKNEMKSSNEPKGRNGAREKQAQASEQETKPSSPRVTRGQKRERSQATLEDAFKRTKR